MEKSTTVILLVLVLALAVLPNQLHSYYNSYYWLNIDCGGTDRWEDPLTTEWWELDGGFIQTGQNILLSVSTDRLPLETLRYFPEGTRNCYSLPLEVPHKYLIRAGFYYGNYDNLFKPPTFNLEIDGNLWGTVITSLGTDPIYHEIIYYTRKEKVNICLNQTQQGQIPFISSLEAIPLTSYIYRLMNNKTALYLERRINYGANQTFPERFSTWVDDFYRFWKPEQLPKYQNLFNGIDNDFFSEAENYPPYKVLNYAIRGQNVSDSIVIPVDFHEKNTQLSAYFVFYFYHVGGPRPILNNVTNQIVYINGVEKNATTVRPYDDCVVVSVYPVNVTGTANVTIAPAQGTTLPPILNAMEVFTAIDVSTSSMSLHSCTSWFVFFGVVVVLGFVN